MKYILGGGLSGLILAYYNRDFTIVSENLGGQMLNDFPLGPRLMQKTDYTKIFLKQLKIDAKIKTSKIGYSDGMIFYSFQPLNFAEKYFIQSRKTSKHHFTESVMSGSKSSIDFYDVKFDTIINKLIESLGDRHIKSNVSKIDPANSVFYIDEKKYEYDNLISTIPMPLFMKLSELNVDKHYFSALDKSFVLTKKLNLNDYHDDFDYIYYIDKPYNRIMKWDDRYIIEFTGYKENKIFDFCKKENLEIEKYLNLSNIQIRKSIDKIDLDIKNVEFVGRYAQWKHSIKTQEVIRYAIER